MTHRIASRLRAILGIDEVIVGDLMLGEVLQGLESKQRLAMSRRYFATSKLYRWPGMRLRVSQSSSRSRLFCKPSLDQRLIRNIPLVSSNLDAFKKRHGQA
jgi:hypothetical protein